MKNEDRKAAIAAYKEQKVIAGVFAVHERTGGKVWIGTAPNLDTIQNRIWFSLKGNVYRGRSLQTAWSEGSESDFRFEVLEAIDEETDTYIRDKKLKERQAEWISKLQAEAF